MFFGFIFATVLVFEPSKDTVFIPHTYADRNNSKSLHFCCMQVQHSRTSSLASYKKDFHELISTYSRKGKSSSKNKLMSTNLEENFESSDNESNDCMDEHNGINEVNVDDVEGDAVSVSDNEVSSPERYGLDSLKDRQLSVEYLEDECDFVQDVDDLDGKTLLWVNLIDPIFHAT